MVFCTKIEQQLDNYEEILIKNIKQKNCLQLFSVIIAVVLEVKLFVFFESFN